MLKITDYAFPSPDQWRMAIKGMRNAYKSWDKSDSELIISVNYCEGSLHHNIKNEEITGTSFSDKDSVGYDEEKSFELGPSDKNLLLSLDKLGSGDRKAIRQSPVHLEIMASLKWWDQMDQYKVGTTTNSTSQMHTLLNEPFSSDMFSDWEEDIDYFTRLCDVLNRLRDEYFAASDKDKKHKIWRKILNRIPQSYLYTRNWYGSLENLVNIYIQRHDHKLEEWRIFCNWILENVPLLKELVEVIECTIV